jgi:D-alanine-D-alanine ligase
MRVAVVRNCSFAGTINAFGRLCGDIGLEETAQMIAEALRDAGHTVEMYEGDTHLLPALERFMPPHGRNPSGMVFNLARGIQGECPRSHVPALLEMAGYPYTGPTPLGHVLTLDRVVGRTLLRQGGIPTPNHLVTRWSGEETDSLSFPLLVRPRFADAGLARVVRSHRQLADAIDEVVTTCEQEALVEEFIDALDVSTALLGNGEAMEFFPLIQRAGTAGAGEFRVPPLAEDLALRIRASALAAFHACRCQDYARIDFRIDADGNPLVVGIDAMPSLDGDGSYAFAAAAGGCDYGALVQRIQDAAHHRYYGVPAPRFDTRVDEMTSRREAEVAHDRS